MTEACIDSTAVLLFMFLFPIILSYHYLFISTTCCCPCPLTCSTSVLYFCLIGSGGSKEAGRPGAAGGFGHQHSGHPADGENKAANRGSRVKEGAGRPFDASGRPGPEDRKAQTETQRPGRDGRHSLPLSLTGTALT